MHPHMHSFSRVGSVSSSESALVVYSEPDCYSPGTIRPLRLHGGGNAESMGGHHGSSHSIRTARPEQDGGSTTTTSASSAAIKPVKKRPSFLSQRRKFASDEGARGADTTLTREASTAPPSAAITRQNSSLVVGPGDNAQATSPAPPRHTMTILAEFDEADSLDYRDCRSLEVTLEPRILRAESSMLLQPIRSTSNLLPLGSDTTGPSASLSPGLLDVDRTVSSNALQHPSSIHHHHRKTSSLGPNGQPGLSFEPYPSRNTSITTDPLLASGTQGMTCSPHRLIAAPVVPIVPLTDESARRRMAREMESRFAGNADENNNNNTTTNTEAVAPQLPPIAPTTHESEEAPHTTETTTSRKRDGKAEKTKTKQNAASNNNTTSSVASTALNRRQTSRAAREQIIRIGAQRLQQRLDTLHLVTHRIKNDGNCQFRAIAYQLLGSEDYDDIIRDHVTSYMKRVRAREFDHYFESSAAADAYFEKITKPGTWGDELTLRAASDSLYINIHVLSSQEKNFYITYKPSPDAPPPPTFLLDVQKVRARRRHERLQRRWQQQQSYSFTMSKGDSMDGTALLMSCTSQPNSIDLHGGRSMYNDPYHAAGPLPSQLSFTMLDDHGLDGAGFAGDEVDAVADEPIDACGVQQLLQRKLTHTDIVAASSLCPRQMSLNNTRQPSMKMTGGNTVNNNNGTGATVVVGVHGDNHATSEMLNRPMQAAQPTGPLLKPAREQQQQHHHSRQLSGSTAELNGGVVSEVPCLERHATTTTTVSDFARSPSSLGPVPPPPPSTTRLLQRHASVESPLMATNPGTLRVRVDRYGGMTHHQDESSVFDTESPTETENSQRNHPNTATIDAEGHRKTDSMTGINSTTTVIPSVTGRSDSLLLESTEAPNPLSEFADEDAATHRNALRKFKAAGAELHFNTHVPVNVVQHTQMKLLRPLAPPVFVDGHERAFVEEDHNNNNNNDNGRQMPSPTAQQRGRLLRPAEGAMLAQSPVATTNGPNALGDDAPFPTFQTNEEGDVMLLAASSLGTADGRALRQTFASLHHNTTNNNNAFFGGASTLPAMSRYGSPNNSFNPLNLQTYTHGAPHTGIPGLGPLNASPGTRSIAAGEDGTAESDVFFVFENRVDPIDVFLSYLYPVHYNALVIADPADETTTTRQESVLTSSDGTGNAMSPQGGVIKAPFLRRKAM